MDTIYRGESQPPAGACSRGWMRCSWTMRCSAWCGATSPPWPPAGCIAATIPPPAASPRLTRRLGLKTLINLRGPTGNGSDALSREAAGRLGLDFIDMALESRGAPQRDRILRLHEIYRIDAGPGAAALQVRRRPRRSGRRAVRAVRGRLRPRRAAPVVAPLRPYPRRPRPASSTRSSCAGSARARAASPSSTGCARTTMKPPCGGISMPTVSPASSTTGCWRTNDRGRGAGDAADHRLARPVRRRPCSATRSMRWNPAACWCCRRCASPWRTRSSGSSMPAAWAAAARTSAWIRIAARWATAPCRRPMPRRWPA